MYSVPNDPFLKTDISNILTSKGLKSKGTGEKT